ncbi:Inner membrane transport permease YbhR [compost metagenome]
MITLKGFIKKELLQTLRDPRMRMLLFVAPVFQLTVFGVALSTEAKNIRLSLSSAPSDTFMNNIYRDAMASGWFIPAKTTSEDPFAQVQNNEADVVLVAPMGGLTSMKNPQLQMLINATNVTRAQSIERYLQSIIPRSMGMMPPPGIQFDVRVLFNPALETSFFLIPGVMSLLACLITVLLTSMSITKEKEMGTFETLIAAPVSPSEVILGKTIPFVILGMANIPLVVLVAMTVFGLPLRGSLLLLMLSALVFICCTVGIGLLISSIAKNQQQAMMGGFLFLFPSVLLSGLVFPVENMPWVLRIFSYINPITYFIELLRNIMLKGGDLRLAAFNILVLITMAAVTVTLSWRRFKTTL